jgi:tryptophan synthase alpha chain
MSSLRETLREHQKAEKGSLLVYLMGGAVPAERYLEIVDALHGAGVTGMEIGFPFSDPMAEGPVIQRAAVEALGRGTHWEDLLALVRGVSAKMPCAVMTYLNPILQRGEARALQDLASAGASALILPDLPVESVGVFRKERKATGVDTVLLASPTTRTERLRELTRASEGFLYVVSRFGTTGVTGSSRSSPAPLDLTPLLASVHELRPTLPALVGFGVAGPEDVLRHRRSGADGVIVGSALQERVLAGASPQTLGEFAQGLVAALAPAT